MNWDQVEGQWKVLKGSVREQWGKLTDQDYESIGGKKDKFVGKLQERYGIAKEKAERELDDFISNMNDDQQRQASSSTQASFSNRSNNPSSIKMDMEVQKNSTNH